VNAVITAVYEITADDPAARATAVAVEQSHELPTELASEHARAASLGVVTGLEARPGLPTLATIEYPLELAGDELPQLLVLLLGNVSLQDGVRLVDVQLPEGLVSALGGGPGLGADGIRRLTGVTDRALLAAALKPVGSSSAELAELAYQLAVGGLDIVKEDQGLANQTWAPYDERIPAIAAAVARANAETGRRTLYLPCVTGPGRSYRARLETAVAAGADGALLLPGISGFDRLAEARELLGPDRVILQHPSFLGGFTASPTHGISPEVLFGTLSRLAGADAVIFPSWGGRFSLSRDQCVAIASRARAPLGGAVASLPAPGGGMSIDRVPELVDAYGRDVLLLIGADLFRGGAPRAAAERFLAAAESVRAESVRAESGR
jgi:ribulose-bisphosphate carboxylase large chain